MLRILRAFAWLRWRMLVNSLEKTGSRDALERFSIAIEKLGPILAALLLVPSAFLLAGLGLAAGYTLATGGSTIPLSLTRYLLFVVPVLAAVGPLLLPGADRTNPVRMLLLPIPRATLYVAQSATALGDPWNLLLLALVAGIPIGLGSGGAAGAAFVTLAGAGLLVLFVVGISALATSILHLVARDRRRGELAALLFIVIIPVAAMLPALLGDDGGRRRGEPRSPLLPAWVKEAGSRAMAAYPSELFIHGTRASAAGDGGRAGGALAGLAAVTLIVHAGGALVFRRVLEGPSGASSRRSTPVRPAWMLRLPGLTRGASAVATAQLRLALRTPRGRSILLTPLAMFAIFGAIMYRSGQLDFGPFRFGSGLGLATFATFTCLLSILPLAMNQFAVDRAGLTMTLLSPLRVDELLAGKAAGNLLVTLGPMLVCMLAALFAFPGGSPPLWTSLPLGLLGSYLLVAPIGAIVSAVFPRAVDMNSIGRGSNAHAAAGLIGLVAFLIAGAPPVLLALLAMRVLDRPWLAPALIAGWCLVTYIIARLLFIPARRIFEGRRENLAMMR